MLGPLRYDDVVPPWHGFSVTAAVLCLILPLALAFDGGTTFEILRRLPLAVRLLFRCWSAIPHPLASISYQVFLIHWLIIYALLPTLITVALWRARERDPEQLGSWLDFAVLLILGLVVEFGRFEPASPAHLGASNRIQSHHPAGRRIVRLPRDPGATRRRLRFAATTFRLEVRLA